MIQLLTLAGVAAVMLGITAPACAQSKEYARQEFATWLIGNWRVDYDESVELINSLSDVADQDLDWIRFCLETGVGR